MIIKIDSLLIIFYGNSFVVTVETFEVRWVHESRAKPVDVPGEVLVVFGVCVADHDT